MQLVKGVVALRKIITDTGGIKGFGGLSRWTFVVWGGEIEEIKSVEVRRKRRAGRRDIIGRLRDDEGVMGWGGEGVR